MELSDGTVIRAGVGEPAVLSVELTQTVNSGEVLSIGSVCAAMAQISLYTAGESPLSQGDSFTLYEVNEDGEQRALGVFLAELPQRKSANVLSLTAYDKVTLLDRDITQWVAGLTGWPYSLWELAGMVCGQCGIALEAAEIPNGSHPVQKFSAQGITGRQVISWIAQGACSFCRANREGQLQFGWYASADKTYAPDGESYYYQDGLVLADFTTAPIERVCIRAKEEDVGTVYPESAGEKNTYILTGNPLLTAEDGETLVPVAQALYERLSQVRYTPCALTVVANEAVDPGGIVTVTDLKGQTYTVYVMERRRSGGRDTLTCTGTARLDSTTAVNNQSYSALSGKVLSLRTDVDGILAENEDTSGRLSKLELDLDGITSTVKAAQEENKTALTALEQSAKEISVSVQTIIDDGVEKVSTNFGLTVDGSAVTIHREGSEMENCLDEKGMSVLRSGEVMLKADADGVLATDVTVNNYLSIGHARFEDYANDEDSSRTACFFV